MEDKKEILMAEPEAAILASDEIRPGHSFENYDWNLDEDFLCSYKMLPVPIKEFEITQEEI